MDGVDWMTRGMNGSDDYEDGLRYFGCVNDDVAGVNVVKRMVIVSYAC